MTAPGVPWVLLRGLMRDGRHWGGFRDRLQARFGDAPIVTIDFPGNGDRHGEPSLASVQATADFCRDELRRRGMAPPYRVLAMSMGAMVAVSWASRFAQELECGVLINTSLRPFSAFWQRLRPGAYFRVLRMALTPTTVRQSESLVLELTSRGEHHGLLDQWTRWREQRPVSRSNALRQLAAAARFVAPRTAPRTPLLILAASRDDLVSARCSRQLAAAWRCEIREHPQAGHDLPLDDPDWVLQQIVGWLASRG